MNNPVELLKVSHSDLATHVYLKAKINNRWIKLDSTWDSGLSKIFPISKQNGKSDTVLAVNPKKTYDLDKSEKVMNNVSNKEEFYKDTEVNGKFYQALNDYFNRGRAKNNHQSDLKYEN